MRSDTDKTQLYDRQLRLWQKTGQAALESASVCVLGSSALASESLKNLVLPGIGEMVVIDDAQVDKQDIKTNFFVRPDDTGKPRACCIVENLCELNPEVRGSAIVESPAAAVQVSGEQGSDSAAAAALDSASLVICCNQPDSVVCKLSRKCSETGKPLIVATSAGFMSCIRTSVAEHTVIESHADGKPDLRIMCPFASLRDHVDSIDLNALDPTDVAHVPFVVLIIKALQRFAAKDDDDRWANYPNALKFAEKKEIRSVIQRLATVKSDEENFEEATKNVMPLCVPYEIPSEVKQILDDPAAAVATAVEFSAAAAKCKSDLTQQVNHRFWLLANALRRYVASDYSEGKLPISGTIPDMKADTKGYIALQRIFKNKAEQDKAEFARHVANVLEEAHLSADYFSQEDIGVFCKNANRLRLFRTSTVYSEYENGPEDVGRLQMNDSLSQYVLFRASARFFNRHGRYPGAPPVNATDKDAITASNLNRLVESDMNELSAIANELLTKWKGDNGEDMSISADMTAEFARSGFSELHNIASVSAGVIAQEAIKLITHQYVPGNNTFIYDGIQARLFTNKV